MRLWDFRENDKYLLWKFEIQIHKKAKCFILMLIPIPISFVGTPHCPLVHSSYLRNEKLLFNQKKKIEPSQKEWGERGSNSRPQDNSDSYETYALTNCATTPGCNLPWLINTCNRFLVGNTICLFGWGWKTMWYIFLFEI